MTIEKELRRGEQARQIIENPVYDESINTVRQSLINKWVNCPVRDIEGQHELKLMIKMLDDISGHIQRTFETGKMAQIQLESDSKVTKFKRAVGF